MSSDYGNVSSRSSTVGTPSSASPSATTYGGYDDTLLASGGTVQVDGVPVISSSATSPIASRIQIDFGGDQLIEVSPDMPITPKQFSQLMTALGLEKANNGTLPNELMAALSTKAQETGSAPTWENAITAMGGTVGTRFTPQDAATLAESAKAPASTVIEMITKRDDILANYDPNALENMDFDAPSTTNPNTPLRKEMKYKIDMIMMDNTLNVPSDENPKITKQQIKIQEITADYTQLLKEAKYKQDINQSIIQNTPLSYPSLPVDSRNPPLTVTIAKSITGIAKNTTDAGAISGEITDSIDELKDAADGDSKKYETMLLGLTMSLQKSATDTYFADGNGRDVMLQELLKSLKTELGDDIGGKTFALALDMNGETVKKMLTENPLGVGSLSGAEGKPLTLSVEEKKI